MVREPKTELYIKAYQREKKARLIAESILEDNTRRLYLANKILELNNKELEVARNAAQAADKAKSLFIANVSHELRTPLHAIIGYCEILKEEAQKMGLVSFCDDLDQIDSSGKHLLGLINDILSLTKIESGNIELYLEDINVTDLIHSVCSQIFPLLQINNNELNIEYDPNMLWHTDLTKIKHCLLNLVSNANKFTSNGTITLKIEEIKINNDEWVQVQVIDTGIGIPEDKFEHIFDAFTQADPSITRKYGGTGLGLFITKNFCELLGGTISVESRQNEGSTFTMRIPANLNVSRNTSEDS